MIEVEGLRKSYGDFVAVKGCSFTVESGSAIGVIGPNGAGKTTTLKMLVGLIAPTEGTARVNDEPITDKAVHDTVGFLPEENPVYDEMTGMEYLRFFADLYGVPREVANERIARVLDRLELDGRDKRIGNMSKGMTRKTLIARSLVHDPDVVIYDEPASGLDPVTTNEILDFIGDLREQEKTVVFSAHNLHHVEEVCDKVVMMESGEVAASGTLEEIRATYADPQYRVVATEPFQGSEETDAGNHRALINTVEEVNEIKADVADSGGEVLTVQTVGDSLKDIFLDLTSTKETAVEG